MTLDLNMSTSSLSNVARLHQWSKLKYRTEVMTSKEVNYDDHNKDADLWSYEFLDFYILIQCCKITTSLIPMCY